MGIGSFTTQYFDDLLNDANSPINVPKATRMKVAGSFLEQTIIHGLVVIEGEEISRVPELHSVF